MLTLDHISKTFNPGTINEKRALDGLSLHLKPGDFVGLTAGKKLAAQKTAMVNSLKKLTEDTARLMEKMQG